MSNCNHKHEDGTCAIKDISYWHSEPWEWYCDYSGETEYLDNGYTVYAKECSICKEEIN